MKVSKDFHEAFRRLGVQNPGEVDVGQPVFTVPLDASVQELAAPLTIPTVAGWAFEAAHVGDNSGLRIVPGGRGIWLLQVRDVQGAAGGWCMYTDNGGAWNLVAAVGPDFLPTGRGETVIEQGFVASISNSPFRFQSGEEFLGPPIWIPRAQELFIVGVTANQAAAFVALWKEVPRRGANPDED